MPNTFLTPDIIARATLGLLQREIVLPRLVWRDPETDFRGTVGDTVTIRLPATTTAHEYDRAAGQPIQVDTLAEIPVPVKIDRDVYNAVAVTDEELTLSIERFGAQVLDPQVRAVAEHLENLVAGPMNAIPDGLTTTPDLARKAMIAAATRLNKANVPRAQRTLVVGADYEAALLDDEVIVRADASGTTDALRESMIARLHGFDIVASNAIAPDTAIAMHRTAFALVTRAPAVPDGAAFGQGTNGFGLAMRWIRDYDPTRLQDRSVVSALAGVTTVLDDGQPKRAVKITLTDLGAGTAGVAASPQRGGRR